MYKQKVFFQIEVSTVFSAAAAAPAGHGVGAAASAYMAISILYPHRKF